MSDQRAKYADKINKLLAQAASTPHPEEAETAFMMAQQLMAKYAIDEAMLSAARGEDKGEIVREEFVSVGIYRYALGHLSNIILMNNGCKQVLIKNAGSRTIDGKVYRETYVLVSVGYKSDIDNARALLASLTLQALMSENRWWEENKHIYEYQPKGAQHRARRGFLFSFGDGVHHKLKTATVRGKREAEAEHGETGVAMVLRDKSKNVEDALANMFPNLKSSYDRKGRGDAFAQGQGFQAGVTANVGQPGLRGNKELT